MVVGDFNQAIWKAMNNGFYLAQLLSQWPLMPLNAVWEKDLQRLSLVEIIILKKYTWANILSIRYIHQELSFPLLHTFCKISSYFLFLFYFIFCFSNKGFVCGFGGCPGTSSCIPSWFQTHRGSCASVSRVLGIKKWVTTTRLQDISYTGLLFIWNVLFSHDISALTNLFEDYVAL